MLRVTTLLLALLIIGSSVLNAAPSPPAPIGLPDPARIRSIAEFRLPSWGYRTIQLGFDLRGSGKTTNDDYRVKSAEGLVIIQPGVSIYSESEDAISDIALIVNGEWSTSRYKDYDWRYPHDYENRYVALSADIEGEWKRYLRPSHFLTIAADARGLHELRHTEEQWLDREKEVSDYTYNTYDVDLMIGLGFGRVRDVTPVVRALRLGERLAALGKLPGLSDREVQGVAEHFTRRLGYSRVYSRSGKYFWDDLRDIVDGMDTLTPFETYYVTDVQMENLGDRLEGWEIAAGPSLASREYDGRDRNAVLPGFARGTWYRNHTLDHQTGLEIEGKLGRHIDGSADLGAEGSVRFYAEHLWVIADRLVWRPHFSATVAFLNVDATDERKEWLRADQRYSLNSAFTFYIEDRVSLNSLASFGITRLDRETYDGHRYMRHRTEWRVSLSLTYYLDRTLW